MTRKPQEGFSLLETMVALAVLLGVGGIVMSGMTQMMKTQGTIANRTEMHTSVRSATELLSQEVGQAGKVALPHPGTPVTLSAASAINDTTITVSNSAGMFDGEQLVIDGGPSQEQVTVNPGGISGSTVTLTKNMVNAHPNLAPVTVLGAFSSGIVPPTMANGSSATVLKLYGDLNGDGNMLYVEYTCDTTNGILYRQQLAFDAPHSAKIVTPTATQEATMALLTNITPNPPPVGATCFTYQVQPVGVDNYVTDVAITLTAQTANVDPTTRQLQKETKALLNVSPRNVFDAFNNATLKNTNRVQPMPPSVTALLP
jgi:type II secretory pathway pseudopilin PulG